MACEDEAFAGDLRGKPAWGRVEPQWGGVCTPEKWSMRDRGR